MTQKSVILLFPGQGSQYVGMGKGEIFREAFDKASEVLNFDLGNLCIHGPEKELKLTRFTQPAILTHSYALYSHLEKVLKHLDCQVEAVLGHSVGEYAALVASNCLNFENALKAVHTRGLAMQEAVNEGVGSMVALLKVPQEMIERACQSVSKANYIASPANFNGPGQTVISGHRAACLEVVDWLEKNYEGKMRSIELPVSAPFHCELMKPAADKLKAHLDQIEFRSPQIPYYANYDSSYYDRTTSGDKVRQNLIDQVCGSVLWSQSIEKLQNARHFIEVGPGKVLTGLARKINRDISCVPLDGVSNRDELNDKVCSLWNS